jgi:hypothetical protein
MAVFEGLQALTSARVGSCGPYSAVRRLLAVATVAIARNGDQRRCDDSDSAGHGVLLLRGEPDALALAFVDHGGLVGGDDFGVGALGADAVRCSKQSSAVLPNEVLMQLGAVVDKGAGSAARLDVRSFSEKFLALEGQNRLLDSHRVRDTLLASEVRDLPILGGTRDMRICRERVQLLSALTLGSGHVPVFATHESLHQRTNRPNQSRTMEIKTKARKMRTMGFGNLR